MYCFWFKWCCNNGWKEDRRGGSLERTNKSLLLSVHCVAHKINFATLDTTSVLNCKDLLKYIDNIINIIVGHFEKSSKRINVLQSLQVELNDAWKIIKQYKTSIFFQGDKQLWHFLIH